MIIKPVTFFHIIARGFFRIIPRAPYHVIPAQAGIHKAVQGLTASRFRLKTTEMTGGVNTVMTRIGCGVQSGFTLLEMVLVLFLIGLMASATLMLTENVEDQAKYDETKRRMEMMRKAIVGDPTRTINGGPEISGFVADMGRLPLCIAELLRARNCADDDDLTLWNLDPSTGLGSGWRGPYIQVLPERNGDLRFRDGYGNTGSSTTVDAQNSGWFFSQLSNASGAIISIDVSSAAYDLVDSGDDISNSSLIISNDWLINTININFINQNTSDALPTAPVQALLRVYSGSKYDDADNSVPLDVSNAIPANSGSSLKTFIFDTSTAIPTIGHRGYAVVCYNIVPPSSAAIPANYIIFDGDCNNASNSIPSSTDIKSFTIAPRQTITLDWIIQ